jgi:hypothetical protein
LAHHIESDLMKEATTENHIMAVSAMIYTLSRSEEQPQTMFAGATIIVGSPLSFK